MTATVLFFLALLSFTSYYFYNKGSKIEWFDISKKQPPKEAWYLIYHPFYQGELVRIEFWEGSKYGFVDVNDCPVEVTHWAYYNSPTLTEEHMRLIRSFTSDLYSDCDEDLFE